MSGDGEGDGLRKRKRYGDRTQAEEVAALLEHFPEGSQKMGAWLCSYDEQGTRPASMIRDLVVMLQAQQISDPHDLLHVDVDTAFPLGCKSKRNVGTEEAVAKHMAGTTGFLKTIT